MVTNMRHILELLPLTFRRGKGRLYGTLLAFAFSSAQAAPDLAVTVRGTANAVVGGQTSYIVDISNVAPVGTANDATNASLTINLTGGGLTNIYWDCLAFFSNTTRPSTANNLTCGSNTRETNTSSSVTLSGLNIPAGGASSTSLIRVAIQGTVSTLSNVTGSASVSVTGDTATANNSGQATTNVANFPPLCPNFEEIARANASVRSLTYPLDSSVTITTSVTGGTTDTARGATAVKLAYLPNIDLGPSIIGNAAGDTTPGIQRTNGVRVSGGTDPFQTNPVSYTVSFSKPVPARELYLSLQDVNLGNPTIRFEVTGTATPGDFVSVPAENEALNTATDDTGRRPLAYDSTGRLYLHTTTAAVGVNPNPRGFISLYGTGNGTVSSMRITGNNVYQSDLWAYVYGFQVRCPVYEVTKAVSTPYVRVNDDGTTFATNPAQVTYTIDVKNVGTGPGTNVTTTDTLPTGLTYASASGTPTLASGQPSPTTPVTFTLPQLDVGATQRYTIVTNVALNRDTNQSALLNTATTNSNGFNVVPATSNQTRTDVIYPKLVKQVRNVTRNGALGSSADALPGEVLEYCLRAFNYSSVSLPSFTVTDDVPGATLPLSDSYGTNAGIRLVQGGTTTLFTNAADTDAGTLTSSGGLNGSGQLQVRLGSFPAGAQAESCFQVRVR